ncbi:MAG TPA: methyltransferase [Anaerolineae bacterium]
MALARRYANVQATVFELPAAAEVAREIIADEGMANRVSVQVGDFQKEELGSGYDLLLLFGVLVSETPAGKLALLRKAHAALVPGGMVAVRGFWLNDDRTAPVGPTLFSLHMLLSTDAGDISTRAEMRGWLSEAGFERPHTAPLPAWVGSTLILAYK